MTGDPVEILLTDLFLQHGCLFLRPLIGPDDRPAQRPSAVVHAQTTHHLSAETDRGDILRIRPGPFDQFPGGDAHRLPPVLCILLRPGPVEVIDLIAVHFTADELTVCRKQTCLVAGCAQVMGKYISAHGLTRSPCCIR